MSRKQHLSVTMAAATVKRVTKAAAAMDMNRSEFVEMLLVEALESNEHQLAFMSNPRVMKAFAEAFSKPGVMAAMAKAIGHEVTEAERQAVLDFMKRAGGAS